jgi:hypothetical protein
MEWWSIEVFHGPFSAARWKDAHSSSLIESAIANGAVDWVWHEHRWGVVFEVAFNDDEQWQVFRDLPSVRAALDAVPDLVNGLLVYRGRGGGAGASARRRPRPHAGAGAVALPEPEPFVEASYDMGPPIMGPNGAPDELTAADRGSTLQQSRTRGLPRVVLGSSTAVKKELRPFRCWPRGYPRAL